MNTALKLTPRLLFLLLSGCATITAAGDKALLDFLDDGKTSKQAVTEKLGLPSGSFEREKILTYRIGSTDENGYFVVDRLDKLSRPRNWSGTKFSLVLVFDESGVLRKHALVPIQ